jgi:hypothetical protein
MVWPDREWSKATRSARNDNRQVSLKASEQSTSWAALKASNSSASGRTSVVSETYSWRVTHDDSSFSAHRLTCRVHESYAVATRSLPELKMLRVHMIGTSSGQWARAAKKNLIRKSVMHTVDLRPFAGVNLVGEPHHGSQTT